MYSKILELTAAGGTCAKCCKKSSSETPSLPVVHQPCFGSFAFRQLSSRHCSHCISQLTSTAPCRQCSKVAAGNLDGSHRPSGQCPIVISQAPSRAHVCSVGRRLRRCHHWRATKLFRRAAEAPGCCRQPDGQGPRSATAFGRQPPVLCHFAAAAAAAVPHKKNKKIKNSHQSALREPKAAAASPVAKAGYSASMPQAGASVEMSAAMPIKVCCCCCCRSCRRRRRCHRCRRCC